jgi:hypothetical protein
MHGALNIRTNMPTYALAAAPGAGVAAAMIVIAC